MRTSTFRVLFIVFVTRPVTVKRAPGD